MSTLCKIAAFAVVFSLSSLAYADGEPAAAAPPDLALGALPMAPPPEAAPPDLVKRRFQLAGEQGTFVSNGAAAWGVGLRGAYSPTSALGLNLEGDAYRSFSGEKLAPVGRLAGGIQIDFLKDEKPVVDLFHSTFDVYFLAQAGVLFTHPTPLGVDYPYKPSLDVTAGLGFRYFMGSYFALTLESSLDLFSHDNPVGDPALLQTERESQLASTTWIGLTFFFGAPKAG